MLAALDARTGKQVQWSPPPPAGDVDTITVAGREVVAGGSFAGVGGAERNRLAAIDATTGALTAWNPSDPWSEITGLAADKGVLYVSGVMKDGAHRLRALSEATGAVLPWSPAVNGDVWAASDGLVFIAEDGLVAVDEATGASRWTLHDFHDTDGVSVAGGTVYLAGRFTSIDGQPRSGLAALNAATGKLTPWQPNGGQLSALAATATHVYTVDQDSGLISAFDPSTGARIWQVPISGGGPIVERTVNLRQIAAIATTASAVIVVGTFDAVAGKPHVNLVALDPQTGAVLPWNPAAPLPPDPAIPYDYETVTALTAAGQAVEVGGEFTLRGSPRRTSPSTAKQLERRAAEASLATPTQRACRLRRRARPSLRPAAKRRAGGEAPRTTSPSG